MEYVADSTGSVVLTVRGFLLISRGGFFFLLLLSIRIPSQTRLEPFNNAT